MLSIPNRCIINLSNTRQTARDTETHTAKEAHMRTAETLGSGYTTAEIIADRLPKSYGTSKFIGYIPTKNEWIIASHAVPYGYCWSEYFMSLDSLLEEIKDDKALMLTVIEYMDDRAKGIDYSLKVEEVKAGVFSLRATDAEGECVFSHADGYRTHGEAMHHLAEEVGMIDLDRREEYDGRY